MGLFSSRYETHVATQVVRVVEDNMLPDSIKQGNVQALIAKSSQTTEYVMENLVTGMATKAEQFYRYGKNKYSFGLPAGNTYSAVTGQDVVEAALEADVGPVESITYYKLGAANLIHIGWLRLVRDHAYDSQSNTMVVNGTQVYLSNIQPVVVESNFGELANGSMDLWGTPPYAGFTPERKLISTHGLSDQPVFIVDPNALADYIKVSYAWETQVSQTIGTETITHTEVHTDHMNLYLTDDQSISTEASYFQVRYMQNGKAGYWMYRMHSGLKPAIEAIFDHAPTTAGTFFPWGYFRYDKKKSNENRTTDEYKTSKKLMKFIGIDFDTTADAINDNPDIGDVEQAMIMMAVPANTTNELDRKYLFDFFSKMYISSTANGDSSIHPIETQIKELLGGAVHPTTIIMRDKRFKMALSYDNIVKRRVAGKIGKVGAHDSGTNINPDTKKAVDVFGGSIEWTTVVPTHYFRRQITEDLYEELLVTKLKMVYYIWGDYNTTGDETDDILMVPLDYSITHEYELLEREKLYARSLHYIFNSRVTVKIRWYQTGIFKSIITIAAVFVSILTLQPEIYTLAAAIATAYAVSSVVALMIAASIYALDAIIAQKITNIFIKKIDSKLAMVLTVIAIASGVYQLTAEKPIAFLPSGKDLLSASLNLGEIAVNKYMQERFSALQGDAKEFEEYKKEKEAELKKAEDLLQGDLRLDPLVVWGESPDTFYQRTVHSGNIGVVGIEAVSSFVEMSLTLPQLTDTLGGLYV